MCVGGARSSIGQAVREPEASLDAFSWVGLQPGLEQTLLFSLLFFSILLSFFFKKISFLLSYFMLTFCIWLLPAWSANFMLTPLLCIAFSASEKNFEMRYTKFLKKQYFSACSKSTRHVGASLQSTKKLTEWLFARRVGRITLKSLP